jgi:hypothetical protein
MSNNEEYFARIPYALYDALEKDEITLTMFAVMIWLYKWADWSIGTVRKACAERLMWATDGTIAKRTLQQAIHDLHVSGLITCHRKGGSKKPYKVTINNYLALSGARKGSVINPSEIKSWRGSDSSSCTDGRVEDDTEAYTEDDTEAYTEDDTDVAPTTRDFSDSARESFPESVQEIVVSLPADLPSDAASGGEPESISNSIYSVIHERFPDVFPDSDEIKSIWNLVDKDLSLLETALKITRVKAWAELIQTPENLVFRLSPNPKTGKSILLEKARKANAAKKAHEQKQKEVEEYHKVHGYPRFILKETCDYCLAEYSLDEHDACPHCLPVSSPERRAIADKSRAEDRAAQEQIDFKKAHPFVCKWCGFPRYMNQQRLDEHEAECAKNPDAVKRAPVAARFGFQVDDI